MILLLGASGFVGQKYQQYLKHKNIPYVTDSIRLPDSATYYTNDIDQVTKLIKKHNPSFVINCAGFTGNPNVDACELEHNRNPCLVANIILPNLLAYVCTDLGIKMGNVSSGCIYQGDMNYNETVSPNFRESVYSKSKLLAEYDIHQLFQYDNVYSWRLRIPFDHIDHRKNFISKIIKFEKLTNQPNSISNINDFVRATVDCYLKELPCGIYNVTNPGSIKAQDIAKILKDKGIVPKNREWEILTNPDEIKKIEKVPRSNCTLDSSKIINLGIPLPDIYESLNKSIESWNQKDTIYW